MKLFELLARHESVSLANPTDNEAILSFFDSFPMKGEGLILQYQRAPDFFKFLQFHSPEFFVFLLRDKGAITGVGTLILRKGFIGGKETWVGYLGDLRVKSGMRNALMWRKFYEDLIHHAPAIEELRGCRHFITAVIDSNKEAQASLIRARKNSFAYHELSGYFMVNISLKKPLKKEPQLTVRQATPEDAKLVREYYLSKEMRKPFGICDDPALCLSRWENFDWNNFYLAFDQDRLVGLAGAWSPSPAKRIILKSLPRHLKLLSTFLRLRKNSFPREGEELRPLYLTHLNFDSVEALRALVFHIFSEEKMRSYHLLSLAVFNPEELLALGDFVIDKIPMALYQVYDNRTPEVLVKKEQPGFEMALV